jgi:hypothetical protein
MLGLSNSDKEFIRNTIKDEIQKALTINVRMERRKDMKTGQPLAVPEIEVKDVYMPSFLVEYIPFIEGAIRGVQEQVCLDDSNRNQQIQAITNILLTFENSIKVVAALSDTIKQHNMIEYKPEDTNDESNS